MTVWKERQFSQFLNHGQREGMAMEHLALNKVVRVIGRATLVVALWGVFVPVAEATGGGSSDFTYPTSCNQVVSGKVVLKQDLTCNDADGLIVGGNHTTIYLNGFSIRCMDADPAAFKFSCQGGDPGSLTPGLPSPTDVEAEDADYGIDTNGFSNVEVIGPGMIQGFDIGVYVYGGDNPLGPSASNVRVRKINVTGPDGKSDVLMPATNPRPQSWGILVQNFVEHGRCTNDASHSFCKCKDDYHGHGVDIYGNSVDNHVKGIALYNSSRVDVRTNFVHDVNDADNAGNSLLVVDGIVICAIADPTSQGERLCTVGVSRRNRIRNNLVVDAGSNYPDSLTPDGGIIVSGVARDNDVSFNTVMANNGDGISVRDGANNNTISNNLSLYNTSTDAPYVVDPITGQTTSQPTNPLFFDITSRRAGQNNIKTNNKCLTENDGVDPTVCNPGENDDWSE
jgi:hypothetical protein